MRTTILKVGVGKDVQSKVEDAYAEGRSEEQGCQGSREKAEYMQSTVA